jgi:F0F1-type ATP synthase assembly protein I
MSGRVDVSNGGVVSILGTTEFLLAGCLFVSSSGDCQLSKRTTPQNQSVVGHEADKLIMVIMIILRSTKN